MGRGEVLLASLELAEKLGNHVLKQTVHVGISQRLLEAVALAAAPEPRAIGSIPRFRVTANVAYMVEQSSPNLTDWVGKSRQNVRYTV